MSNQLPSEARRELESLRPSCSAVYQALFYRGDTMTTSEISEAACLSCSTVRDAVRDLQDAGLVIKSKDPHNPRTPLYQNSITANSQ